jgi:hypothetical protein
MPRNAMLCVIAPLAGLAMMANVADAGTLTVRTTTPTVHVKIATPKAGGNTPPSATSSVPQSSGQNSNGVQLVEEFAGVSAQLQGRVQNIPSKGGVRTVAPRRAPPNAR